ncbi:transposase [Nonomuraea mangrovi]|uniref:Transposase n=1 Tax=Nonomuraea mangrovi TaxID=2316207 RepID=A0ABW4T9K7_9ACTN
MHQRPSTAAVTSPCTHERSRKPSTRPAPAQAPAWRDRYAIRCGIEATIHQAVTVTGLRRARYRGIKKVHLEHIVSAIAVNLIRLDAWWNGRSLNRKRTSHLARLEPALTA